MKERSKKLTKELSDKKPKKVSKKTTKKALERKIHGMIIISVIALAAILVIIFTPQMIGNRNHEKEVITVSALEKIVNVSKLSTFTAVYNGIAQVMNEESPDKIDYYVSYEAKVKAGIDFKKIGFVVDEENRKVHITLPEIEITEVNVEIASMDYIFMNDKANASTVSQQAYRACEMDATAESKGQIEIYELAEQNAKNTIQALVSPIVEQLDKENKWEIEWEER